METFHSEDSFLVVSVVAEVDDETELHRRRTVFPFVQEKLLSKDKTMLPFRGTEKVPLCCDILPGESTSSMRFFSRAESIRSITLRLSRRLEAFSLASITSSFSLLLAVSSSIKWTSNPTSWVSVKTSQVNEVLLQVSNGIWKKCI